jgi:pyruvate formate lyase activating enzyme
MKTSNKINRRKFLNQFSKISCASLLATNSPFFNLQAGTDKKSAHKFEARWYKKLPHKKVECQLCPRKCVVDDRERGYCGVRENWDGIYYTLVHSNPCTYHVDPIEKKPLFHFLPGTTAFSIATVGCNVDCKFCQNWQISQVRPEQVENMDMPPRKVVQMAKDYSSPSIAYTYTEPVVFSEYMYDTALEGRKKGIKSVMISNGYIMEEPMRELTEVLDAVKVDLKAFTEKYYQELVAGELKPVLDTLVLLRKLEIWTEIVYLVVPTHNDGDKELTELSKWIKSNLGNDIPVHFTRFYPQYQLRNLPPTPVKTLERARSIATAEGLNFVYVGNIPGHPGEHTYCPNCKTKVIERRGYLISRDRISNGKCENCNHNIPGIWK